MVSTSRSPFQEQTGTVIVRKRDYSSTPKVWDHMRVAVAGCGTECTLRDECAARDSRTQLNPSGGAFELHDTARRKCDKGSDARLAYTIIRDVRLHDCALIRNTVFQLARLN